MSAKSGQLTAKSTRPLPAGEVRKTLRARDFKTAKPLDGSGSR
ncbi:hypothetical protein RESH_05107 [Rhodopirellula europaea SH398]|uniref:Uncharacterized protein n=1 Tax=Rhodopirellula europaea SH398 TaxID=1263868 RepID=M5S9G0_9BACT|nr:hypothetical protein RESH_05107 [Rhodopirellula europaea SH398]